MSECTLCAMTGTMIDEYGRNRGPCPYHTPATPVSKGAVCASCNAPLPAPGTIADLYGQRCTVRAGDCAPKPNATTREAMGETRVKAADSDYVSPDGRAKAEALLRGAQPEPAKAAVCECGVQLNYANLYECSALSKLGVANLPQPAPFAVGDRVEWQRGQAVGSILAIDDGHAWIRFDSGERDVLPLADLRRPPAKRVVKQVEWVPGDKCRWADEIVSVVAMPEGRGTLACVRYDDGKLATVLPSALKPLPARKVRTMKQGEYTHVGGAKAWLEEPSGVGHIWTPTGRTHNYEVDDE